MDRFRLLSLPVLLTLLTLSACAKYFSLIPTAQPIPNDNSIQTSVAQTLTALSFPIIPPGLTATFTQTATLPVQTPKGFISYYFDNINARNYQLTWSLLSDRFKHNLNGTSQGGYQVYVSFWNSVNQVTVKDVSYLCQGDLCAVYATLQLYYKNGQLNTTTYPYTLTYDHTRNTWLFDFIPVPTASPSKTGSATATRTRTLTRTPITTATKTNTPTASRTFTITVSLSQTASITPSQTPSSTATLLPSPTFTWTSTDTPTVTATIMPTGAPSATPTATATPTFTPPAAASDTSTWTLSETPTFTMTTGP